MTTTTTTGKVYLNYVDQWLDTLSAAESEDFREFAEATPSTIEIWVYAGIIGYPGSFVDLSRWVKMKFRKIDTTFESSCSKVISLSEALEEQNILSYTKQATGEKFLINPNG